MVLADNPEAWRLKQLDPPVALAFMAGDERVQRRLEAERARVRWNIVDDAIGDHEDAAEAFQRHVGEPRIQGRKQPGAVGFAIGAAALDDADLDIAERIEAFLKSGAGFLCLRGPFADRLAAALIDDHGHDLFQRVAVLAHQSGAGDRQEQQAKAKRAEKAPAAACIKRQSNEAKREHAEPEQDRPGQ